MIVKDLCGRIPYNVKIHAKYTDLGETIELDGIVKMVDTDGFVGIEVMYDRSSSFICADIDNVKPYLFPIASMTEEQKDEFDRLYTYDALIIEPQWKLIDWLNRNHFDYGGLIEKGLAIDATGLNIY